MAAYQAGPTESRPSEVALLLAAPANLLQSGEHPAQYLSEPSNLLLPRAISSCLTTDTAVTNADTLSSSYYYNVSM